MEIGLFLMLALSITLLAGGPYGLIGPAFILSSSWFLIFLLQSITAPDMVSSGLAVITIFLITLSFAAGEYAACPRTNYRLLPKLKKIEINIHNNKKFTTLIFLFGTTSILGAIQYADVLGMFNVRSFAELVALPGIVREDIFGDAISVPYLSRFGFLFAFSGVVLSLGYYFINGWRWFLILPMTAVVIMGLSQAGRAGTVIVIVQSLLTLYLRQMLIHGGINPKFIIKLLSLLVLFFGLVFFGGQLQREGFSSASLGDFIRVAASLRSYLFGGVSAYAVWIDGHDVYDIPTFGIYSFSSLFAFLGIHPQASGVYDQYAIISAQGDETNLYTAYRSFVEDFTMVGACIFYLSSGFFISKAMLKLLNGGLYYVLILIPALSWLAWSPLYSLTYFNSFLLSLILPFIALKSVTRVKNRLNTITRK